MLRTLQLILPALIPSWNFFDVIAPSPRIEYAFCNAKGKLKTGWQAFRPRPQALSTMDMLRRLIWNPHWNETLFLNSCAERLSQGITPDHSVREILTRMKRDLSPNTKESHFKFRLVFVHREDDDISQEEIFVSEPEALR